MRTPAGKETKSEFVFLSTKLTLLFQPILLQLTIMICQKSVLWFVKKRSGDNVEKIELRYVAYNRVEKGTFSTVSQYRESDLTILLTDDGCYKRWFHLLPRACWGSRLSRWTIFKEYSSEDGYNSEKRGEAKKKLEQCLPILLVHSTHSIISKNHEYFRMSVARFAENEKNKSNSNHKRSQHGALKVLCDEAITEATYVLNNKHLVSSELIKKIAKYQYSFKTNYRKWE